MRIQNTRAFSQALRNLKGNISYSRLAFDIAVQTDGLLSLEPVTLHRLATGAVGDLRSLQSADEATAFVLAMMVRALREGRSIQSVSEDGKTLLENLVGPRTATLALSTIEETIEQGEPVAGLLSRLGRYIRWWLLADDQAHLPSDTTTSLGTRGDVTSQQASTRPESGSRRGGG